MMIHGDTLRCSSSSRAIRSPRFSTISRDITVSAETYSSTSTSTSTSSWRIRPRYSGMSLCMNASLAVCAREENRREQTGAWRGKIHMVTASALIS
ncbi:hypothetical protein FIBSPDRAFT_348181 [Athelia psychrophila]|uniref:Uncharacterized protein n=1 Tax=Athelia psychrophila TaxID=1759441 RepID=A0A167W102_9AGAM|nr:hypothetical protein FIBSPDRAFT_348181 [Fibularhizoctonia sp. CBS 109695]